MGEKLGVRVLLGLLVATPGLEGCGADCSDHLDVGLPAGYASGTVSFTGSADGAVFRCKYSVFLPDPAQVIVDGSCSEGPVDLEIRRSQVTARFTEAPERVDYLLQFGQSGGTPMTAEGTLKPAYSGDECRNANETLSQP